MKKLLLFSLLLSNCIDTKCNRGSYSTQTCNTTQKRSPQMDKTSKTKSRATQTRKTIQSIDPIFTDRWSPRAMSGETITKTERETIFDAARWAQSAYNNQPWRFIYAERDTPEWDTMFDLLVEFNQQWCKNAGMLVLVVSKNDYDWKAPAPTHSFDAGAACQNMALQGTQIGLVVHGMEGFDYEKARTAFNIPEGYTVEAMFAVGKPGEVTKLPKEMQKREKPSDRKPLDEFVFEGIFKN